MKRIAFDTSLAGTEIIRCFIEIYSSEYANLNMESVSSVFKEEETKFLKTLEDGMKEFEKGADPFLLYTTYGFPFELTVELAEEKGISLDEKDFWEKLRKHRELSRSGAGQKFKAG